MSDPDSAYAAEQVSGKVPPPVNPNPAPAPDVKPPAGTDQLTPEQVNAHNKAVQQRQAAAIAAARNKKTPPLQPPANKRRQTKPAQNVKRVQQNRPQRKNPVQQQTKDHPHKKKTVTMQNHPGTQTETVSAKRPKSASVPQSAKRQTRRKPPQKPSATTVSKESKKIDARNLEFVSGSELAPQQNGEKLLDTENLVKIYDGRKVVDGVAINVHKGEIVGLLGPNGAGKTTSFYMIVGLVPPNGGTVMFNGVDVTKMPMYKRARLGMGYLPQEESIFRKLTVEENIMAVMQTMNYSRKEKKQRCEELLERFSITHIRKNIAMACSGGEKRRVTIARSLVPNPSLIMLDEPFAGVDPIAVNEIQGIVEELRKEGLAILLTDHNARQTLELVDRAYLIYEGKVLREGSQDFLVNDPVSRELYLGDQFTM